MVKLFSVYIPGAAIFEPLAVVAFIGFLVSILGMFRRRIRLENLAFALMVLFMIIWRKGMSVDARRYSLAVLVTAIFYAVYLANHTSLILRWRRFSIMRFKLWRIVPDVLMAVLMVAMVLKYIRFNKYADCLPKIAEKMRGEVASPRDGVFITPGTNLRRISYYSGLEGIPLDSGESLRASLMLHRLYADKIFVVLSSLRSDAPLTAADVGVGEDEWKCLASSYHNNSKKKLMRLYCYKYRGDDHVSVNDAPEGGTIPENGGFEEVTDISPSSREKILAAQLFRADRYAWKIPVGWSINPTHGLFSPGEAAIGAVGERAMCGNWSLGMFSTGRELAVVKDTKCRVDIPYLLEFYVRGRQGSRFNVCGYLYRANGSYMRVYHFAALRLNSEETSHCSMRLQVDTKAYPDASFFHMVLSVKDGELLIDQFRMAPLRAK